ncbi:hypothetical protein CDAR_621981 [Caerostris darwini]|uniref:Uncharacterized protein n=1 Tax=Caerostris darwini TaxID=1538125 RepID=A0AAV4P546_9ARAC|nr:hypothetical protein CDAR_621981 [Caerostris darwini]
MWISAKIIPFITEKQDSPFVCFECFKFVNVAVRIRCYPVFRFQTVLKCAECNAYFTDKLDLLQHASFAAANVKNMKSAALYPYFASPLVVICNIVPILWHRSCRNLLYCIILMESAALYPYFGTTLVSAALYPYLASPVVAISNMGPYFGTTLVGMYNIISYFPTLLVQYCCTVPI